MKQQTTGILKGCYIAFLACCGALLTLAALFDLQLDQLVNSTDNPFGVFLGRTGELPVLLIIPFTAMVFYSTRQKGKTAPVVLKTAGVVLYSLIGCIYMCINLGEYWFIKDDNRTLFCVIFGVLTCLVTLFIAGFLPVEPMQKLKPYAYFLMIAGLGTALSVELVKNIWGRVRFRDLLAAESFEAFTPWWSPQWFTGNKSFPSGHTSAASAALLLTALPSVFPKLRKYETRIFIVTALYTFAVGASRLVVGAHYLSDITVGALVGFAWYYCARRFFLEKKLGQ